MLNCNWSSGGAKGSRGRATALPENEPATLLPYHKYCEKCRPSGPTIENCEFLLAPLVLATSHIIVCLYLKKKEKNVHIFVASSAHIPEYLNSTLDLSFECCQFLTIGSKLPPQQINRSPPLCLARVERLAQCFSIFYVPTPPLV